MRKKSLVILLFLLFAINPLNLPHSAKASDTVTAEGSGETRSDALLDAMRNAVQQVMGGMLESETLVENMVLIRDKIFTRVKGYVKSCDILSQSCHGGICNVKIRASVDRMDLADDVAALVHILPRMNYPTMLVLFQENSYRNDMQKVPVDVSAAEQTVVSRLSEKGFNVVESAALDMERRRQSAIMHAAGDKLAGALEAASYLAQVMVTGKVVAQDNGPSPYNNRIHSYGAVITAKAYETITGKMLASVSSRANAVDISFSGGVQKAVDKAAARLADELSARITRTWLDYCYNVHDITMTVENLSFSQFRPLREAMLNRIRGVAHVNQRSFLRGRAVLVVGWQNCNTMKLAQKLDGMHFKGGRVKVMETQGNAIRIRIVH